MKRRAFISVYDKTGLVDFAKNLTDKFDYEIVAANESFKILKDANIEVINVNEFSNSLLSDEYNMMNETTMAEVLLGCSGSKNLTELEKMVVKPFDMVVVNLRPFDESALESENLDEFMQQIDIAGFTILRAAAKNYKNITVITDKADYYIALNANELGRAKLASKAFNSTSIYDRVICSKLIKQTDEKPFKVLNFEKLRDLPYGENLHQKASVYKTDRMVDYEVISGKDLTFNNILNMTEAVNIVSEFYDVNCAVIVRRAKPSGVALGRSLYDAYTKAFDCDPISSFYGVIGFSKPVDLEVAKHINSMAVEVVVAPDFDSEVIDLFKDNQEVKLVKLNTSLKEYRNLTFEEVILTPFGALVQDRNDSELNKDTFQVVTKTKPTTEQIEDAIFAWKVVKHAKTSSAVVAKDFKTTAISQGQTNIISAVENAINYACDNSNKAVLASDSVLPAEDCIHAAIQGRISLIIQPGGSIKDQKLIEICDKYGIAMISTGIRNYRQ